jgi:hypothetical protein
MMDRLAMAFSIDDERPRRRVSLQIFGDGLELADDGQGGFARPVGSGIKTVIDVIVNQGPLCFANGLPGRISNSVVTSAIIKLFNSTRQCCHVPAWP